MNRYWPLALPCLAALSLAPGYVHTAAEHVPGPAHVQQLTFDDQGPERVINEFAVADPTGRYFVLQHSEDPKLVVRQDGSQAVDFKETSNWDIVRANVDGSGRTQLTSDPSSEDQPTWSPDGSTIVYRKLNGKSFDLYLMDADGSHKRELLIDPLHDEKTPAFSRDGRRVVFFSDRDGIKWNLYSITLDSREVTRLTHEHFEDKHPQYLPDGRVVFHSNRGSRHVVLEGGEQFDLMNLWLLDPGNGQLTQLTTSDDLAHGDLVRDNRHAWVSPDGKYVAYHSNTIEADSHHPGVFRKKHRELCMTTVDGRHRVFLTRGDHRNFKHPTWSADGNGLFFVFKEQGHAWNAGFMDVTAALARLN
jgi:Tol biopolymer transport system component